MEVFDGDSRDLACSEHEETRRQKRRFKLCNYSRTNRGEEAIALHYNIDIDDIDIIGCAKTRIKSMLFEKV